MPPPPAPDRQDAERDARADPVTASTGDDLPSLALASRALALLVAEGISLGSCLGMAVLGSKGAAFATANALPQRPRVFLLQFMLGVAVAAGLAGLLCLRRRGARATWGVARRLCPLVLAGLVPPLLRWEAWVGRELHFLVVAGVLALGLRALTLAASGAPPLWQARSTPGRGAGGWRDCWSRAPGGSRIAALLVCSGALAYAAFFSFHTIAYHRNLFSHSYDLGIFNNLQWNLVHGGPLFKSSPSSGPAGSHLGQHATFFAFVLAPVYALHQQPETLLAVQALLMGAAAVPLFLLARSRVGDWTAAVVALCYLLYPPLHGANLYDFHFLSMSPFFLWTTLYLFERRRDGLGAVAFLMTLSLREDVAAGLIVLGLYLAWWGRRPLAGMAVALVSGLYFVGMKFVVMPLFRADPSFLYAYQGLLPPGTHSFAGVLATIVANPAFTLGTLLDRAKLVYALQILVPLAFLPLCRPIGLFLALPGVVFTLLSTGYAPFLQISFQYTAHWTGFLFLALVLNLGHVRRPYFPGDAMGSARLRAALAALVCSTVIVSHQFGAVLQGNTARAGFDPFRFGTTEADRARRRELYVLIAMIPPRAKVAGSETVVPHVSSRPDAYTVRLGTYDAEYLLFSLAVRAEAEGKPLREALGSGAFGVVAVGSEFVLARRGHGTARNADVLARLPDVEAGLPR
jgi:uncharacterized membrane protein